MPVIPETFGAHSILLSLAIAFVVQIGYLIGQFCKSHGDNGLPLRSAS